MAPTDRKRAHKDLIMPCWRKSMWQPDQTHAT
jgi:hypothetical protein